MSTDTLLSHHLTACGLNADWCVSAWHVGGNEPNTVSGDIYVVEDELAGPLTAEDAILTCEHYTTTTKRTS
mgnify:CR=1 FL=1